jgi:hypothetical protein
MFHINGGSNIVGIGADPDLGVGLHIKSGDSGASVNSNRDELVIEGSGNSGMTILSGTSSVGGVAFGDSDGNLQGLIQYSHANEQFEFNVNSSANPMNISASKVTVTELEVNGGNAKITDDANIYLSLDSTQANGDEWHIFNANSGVTSTLQLKNIDQSKVVMLLNETGNVLIGQTTSPNTNVGLGIASTALGDSAAMYLDTYASNGSQSTFFIRASKNNTVGTKTETTSGQNLGSIYFQGVNSSSAFGYGANITAKQTSSAGSSTIPTDLTFGTSTSSSAITERMVIKSSGTFGFGRTAAETAQNSFAHFYGGEHSYFAYRFENAETATNSYTMQIYNNYAADDNSSEFFRCQDGGANRLIIFADGDVQNHDNAYGSLSDERIKQDIRDSNSQWDDIKAVRVRNFKKKDDVRQYGDNAWEQIGVIAQELETVSPKLVRQGDPSPSDILSDSSFGTLYTADDPETQDGVEDILYTADDIETQDILYTSDDVETQDVLYTEEDELPEGVEVGDVKEPASASVGDVKTQAIHNVGDVKIQGKQSTKKIGDVKEVNEQVKSVNYSVLYMKAVKALQEAMDRIETLESKVATLEGE